MWSGTPGGLREIVLSFKFRQNRLNSFRDVEVEICRFLLLRPVPYITACRPTYRTSPKPWLLLAYYGGMCRTIRSACTFVRNGQTGDYSLIRANFVRRPRCVWKTTAGIPSGLRTRFSATRRAPSSTRSLPRTACWCLRTQEAYGTSSSKYSLSYNKAVVYSKAM